MARTKGPRRAAVFAAMVMVGASALTACAESGGSNEAGGEGIAPGATMEEYQAAFEDLDQITLLTQTPAPKGSVTGRPMEAYYEAVEEWSGGKIKFDISYSNAVADPTEIDDALVDGRLDFASPLPLYEPSEYPANNALIEAGFLSDHSVVNGVMSSNAWPNQVAFATEEIVQEYEDHGMVMMIPVYNSGAQGIFCTEPRSDFDGAVVSASGTAQSTQVESLGAAAASIAYTEYFESLQRGVIDCVSTTPTVGLLAGFLAEAPYGYIDPGAGFSAAPGGLAFSQARWESLPLLAQQLLWDRLDVFVQANVAEKVWVNTAEAMTKMTDAGGTVEPFTDDARAKLNAANDGLLEGLRSTDAIADSDAFVDDMEQAAADWQEKVAGLDFEQTTYPEFPDWWAENKDSLDLSGYTEMFTDEILAEHRPS